MIKLVVFMNEGTTILYLPIDEVRLKIQENNPVLGPCEMIKAVTFDTRDMQKSEKGFFYVGSDKSNHR